MSEQSPENGAPFPTRQRYKFTTNAGHYACSGCGSLVGSAVASVRQHEAWHELLASVIPPEVTP